MIVDKFFAWINVSENHSYYYLSPHVYAVGTCAEHIYNGIIKAKDVNKKIVMLYPYNIPFLFKYRLTNIALLSIESDYIAKPNIFLKVLLRLFITCIYLPLRLLSLLKKSVYGYGFSDIYNFPNIGIDNLFIPSKDTRNFLVNNIDWKSKFAYEFKLFHKNEKENLIKFCKMGIPEDSKFVCLHVRENGFRKDYNRRDYRNADIHNYIPAIQELTNQGLYVIRMGDETMTPLKKMNMVIDYPFTRFKTDSMDMTLIKYCNFYIGCQSGIYDIAKLHHKPSLLLNMYNWTFGGPLHNKDRGILKHIFSKKKEKILSISELFSNAAYDTQDMNNIIYDYIFIENTEKEILNTVIEYLSCIKSNEFKASELQLTSCCYLKEQFYSFLKNNVQFIPKNCKNKYNEEVVLRYRIYSQVEGSCGFISRTYLKDNWESDTLKNEIT